MSGALYRARADGRDLASQSAPGELVDVGGHRLHIWCVGTGNPVVVLDSGLGGTAFDWGHVQPEVARFTRVCSYDRAGMGYSDPGPKPRTSQQIVDELSALLNRTVDGPVVLVGASIGGWNVRLFASEHTSLAAGLVLVDARHEDQTERMAAAGMPEDPPWVAHVAAPVAYLGVARLLDIAPGIPIHLFAPEVRKYVQATRSRSSALAAAASELLSGPVSAVQVRATRRELPIPVVVISAGQRGPHEAEVLGALQRDQATLSRTSCRVIAVRSGHAITFGQPEIVVSAIRAVVHATTRPLDCNSIKE